jgi:hypothetical protein
MRTINRIDSDGFYIGSLTVNDDISYDNNQVITLDQLKQNKLNELINLCNSSILGKFTAQVNGITYSFSNDFAAQSNFKDAKDAWNYGYIPNTQTIKWTAYDVNGNLVRLDLTQEQFDPINIARMQWQQTNVSMLRDTLEPSVNAAQNQSDLDNIKW